MTTGIRNPGDFCWINMLTPEPAAARAFFGALLGWTYVEMPGVGHRMRVAGRDIGAVFDLAGPNTPKGTPPLIGVMMKVDSADAATAKVTARGGSAKPAFDVMDQGRMAVCHDPNGAEFDVWESKKSLGTDADSSEHGVPSWFENLTTDVGGATKFYSELFGWTSEVMPMSGATYTTFKHGPAYVAGMTQITPRMGTLRPHWATYFTVKDVDETAREAVKLGAQLLVPVREVPGIGRFCGLRSPQGVAFHAISYTR
jgi:predicted enzyme related to lactoylglutathione lyase